MTIQLQHALDMLATTNVADTLLALGCTGQRDQPQACPVARFLSRFTDSKVMVGTLTYSIDDGYLHNSRPLPGAVADFVAAFDKGEHPDLVDA